MSYGYTLLGISLMLNVINSYLCEHQFQNNLITGFMAQHTIKCMIMEKMMKLTAATSKNYETGQIHGVKGSAGRLIGFVWEAGDFIRVPLILVYTFYRLMSLTGFSFIFGCSFLVITFRLDKWMNEMMDELHFENGKLHEKMNNITNESFESIRTIKLYGWDDFFRDKVLEYTKEQKEKQKEIDAFNTVKGLMWRVLPQLIKPTTFIIYVASGYKLTLAQSMEIAMLLDWIQWPIHVFNRIQHQIVDLKLCIAKIQDFLSQTETKSVEVKKVEKHPKYAIWIENQNFSWGVQTMDIDELFNKMRLKLRGET